MRHPAPPPVSTSLTSALASCALAVSLTIAVTGCSAPDPVPLGTPQPPAVLTSPTFVPTRTVVPAVPVQSADLGAQVAPIVVPPTQLRVDAVDIDMSVLPMGVDDEGQMRMPDDSSQAGWYEFGPAPGSASGTTVIAAHVDSLEFGLGQFVRLRDIEVGEPVILSTADGVTHTYTVTQITRTPKTDVALDQIFDRAGVPRLVMVTCGGVFNHDTGHYLDNVIVTASPVS